MDCGTAREAPRAGFRVMPGYVMRFGPNGESRYGPNSTPGAALPSSSEPDDISFARATARRAITPTRCARYSELPWMSLFMPSAGMDSDIHGSSEYRAHLVGVM